MATGTRVYSRLTRQALILLGKQIRQARKARRMSEIDLAARAGIARSTLQAIERGSPKAEIGLVFEAATIAGVSLFEMDETALAAQIGRLDDRLALLPHSVRSRKSNLRDDF